jgi:hypothetical protein
MAWTMKVEKSVALNGMSDAAAYIFILYEDETVRKRLSQLNAKGCHD